LHIPIVVRNTLVGRLVDRDRRVGGSIDLTRTTMFFVILVTHRNVYIETTDRCDFGGKPSKWRGERVLS